MIGADAALPGPASRPSPPSRAPAASPAPPTTLHLSQPALSRRIGGLEEQLETVALRPRPRRRLAHRGRAAAPRLRRGRSARSRRSCSATSSRRRSPTAAWSASPACRRSSRRWCCRRSRRSCAATPPCRSRSTARSIGTSSRRSPPAASTSASRRLPSEHARASSTPALGDEEFVIVESRAHPGRRDVFLDVSPTDDTTELFLASQPARLRPRGRWTRSFLHDEPGILLGVELGLGRAVKPRHTVPEARRRPVDSTFAPVTKPVFLQVRRQRYYGRLHQAVAGLIETAVRDHLAAQRPPSPRKPTSASR